MDSGSWSGGTPDEGMPACLSTGECRQNADGSLYWPLRPWHPDGGFDADGGCFVRAGYSFVVDSQYALDLLTTCHFEGGSSMVFPNVEQEDQDAGEAVEVDAGPPTVRNPPVSKSAPHPAPESAPAAAVEAAHTEAAEAAAKAQAVVEHPVAAVADIKAAIPADANIFTVLLGGIAVLGGGAAWKFYSEQGKRKHEQEMARIEKQDHQPGECKAHAAMNAQVSSVAAKVDAVAAKVEAMEKHSEQQRLTMGDWDAEDMTERVEKLEKKVKKLKKAADDSDD